MKKKKKPNNQNKDYLTSWRERERYSSLNIGNTNKKINKYYNNKNEKKKNFFEIYFSTIFNIKI